MEKNREEEQVGVTIGGLRALLLLIYRGFVATLPTCKFAQRPGSGSILNRFGSSGKF